MGKSYTVRKTIEIDKELIEWFESNYPGTSLWWLTNELLRYFKLSHEVTPSHVIAKAANQLKEDIDAGAT